MWQTIIHMAFIVSALGIAWTDKIMQGTIRAPRTATRRSPLNRANSRLQNMRVAGIAVSVPGSGRPHR